MRQWNFDVNIEKRNPWTGNVYFISRMTSDWAERHPLNVDQFIEDVYREFEGTEFEESREELRRVWTAVLAVSSPQGDASLYPNRGGRRRAAAMKVWLLAGDYWRRGFRMGDTLPAIVPGCRITRIGGDGRAIERYSLADRPGTAWIALLPKEIGLLDEVAPAEVADAPALEGHTDITDGTDSFEAVQTTPDPSYSGGEAAAEVDPSSIDPRDEEIAALRARIAELEAQAPSHTEPMEQREQCQIAFEQCRVATEEGDSQITEITETTSAVADTPIIDNVGHQGGSISPEVLADGKRQSRARGSQRGSEQGDDSDADRSTTPAVVQTTPDPSYSGGEAAAQDIEAPEPIVVVAPRPTERERNAAARRRRREQRDAQRRSYEERLEQEAREAEEYARQQERRKIFAAVGAAAVTLVMIYFFGLLGPAVFGLLAGGLLKG